MFAVDNGRVTGSELAAVMLPRFRADSDVWRWDVSRAHGEQMQSAVDDLRSLLRTEDPAEVLDIVQRAIKASITVILRADDSSGLIGDAIQDLLRLHAEAVTAARPPVAKLVRWLIAFQFDGRQDLFEIDPVAYAPALGEKGLALYRSKLADIRAALPPERPDDAPPTYLLSSDDPEWQQEATASQQRFQLEHNAQRLAVLDRDVDAIIATHLRSGRVAAWFEETARALEEIDEVDLAIDWAGRATHHDLGHQAQEAADYWCALIGEHHPEALADARLDVFRRWPTAARAAKLAAAADDWPQLEPDVLQALRSVPREAVLFALTTDPRAALDLYDELGVRDGDVTAELAKALEPVDLGQALPLYRDLVERQLVQADTNAYRPAAKRLARMRRLASGTAFAPLVDAFIAELRAKYPNRTRMRSEFDEARLP